MAGNGFRRIARRVRNRQNSKQRLIKGAQGVTQGEDYSEDSLLQTHPSLADSINITDRNHPSQFSHNITQTNQAVPDSSSEFCRPLSPIPQPPSLRLKTPHLPSPLRHLILLSPVPRHLISVV